MLEERAEAGTGEAMTQELGHRNLKLTFAQANRPGRLRDAEHEKISLG